MAHADHDEGLAHDLPRLISRRRALTLLGGSAAATFAAAGVVSAGAAHAAGGEIPEETAGPFPADGSNGRNVLNRSGIVRRDIRSSFGTSTTTARGLPLQVTLRVLDFTNDSAPLRGAAVYLWHCDRDGYYSMYSRGVEDENYLRGVQVADRQGRVTFTTIFPGCYAGRWPHIHFEVYPTLRQALTSGTRIRTTQLAFPQATCAEAYATAGYQASASNLSRVSLERDLVFADGYRLQLATMTGSPSAGYRAALTVPV